MSTNQNPNDFNDLENSILLLSSKLDRYIEENCYGGASQIGAGREVQAFLIGWHVGMGSQSSQS